MILIATCSLLIVLSAFSGLKDFGLSFSNIFDPDFRVLPQKGKQLVVDSISLHRIETIPGIIGVTPVIEEKVFLSFEQKNHVAFLKGVAPNFNSVIPTKSIVSIGEWISPKSSSVVIGSGIANILGSGVYDYSSFLKITALRNKKASGINRRQFLSFPSSVVGLYQVSEDIDKKYVFSDLSFAKDLLEKSAGLVLSNILYFYGLVVSNRYLAHDPNPANRCVGLDFYWRIFLYYWGDHT